MYFPAFGLNTEIYVFSTNARKYGPEKLRIRTLFTHCNSINCFAKVFDFRVCFFSWENSLSKLNSVYRSSRPEVFCKKGVHPTTLLKKGLWHRCFFLWICEIFKNTFCYRTPPVAASGLSYLIKTYRPLFSTRDFQFLSVYSAFRFLCIRSNQFDFIRTISQMAIIIPQKIVSPSIRILYFKIYFRLGSN